VTTVQTVVVAFTLGVVGFALGLTYAIARRRLLAHQVNSLLWQIGKRDEALKAATGKQDAVDRLIADTLRETRDQQMLRRGLGDLHDVFPEEER
jgi:hypothetical protein